MEKQVIVWEVLADIDSDGAYGDGRKVFRFRKEPDARRFAASNTCDGQRANATSVTVRKSLADRWNCA